MFNIENITQQMFKGIVINCYTINLNIYVFLIYLKKRFNTFIYIPFPTYIILCKDYPDY